MINRPYEKTYNSGNKEARKKDPRYKISDLWFGEKPTSQRFESLRRLIENQGYFGITSKDHVSKVYRTELAYVLLSNNLEVFDLETKKQTTINCKEYLDSFVESFIEGEQYFENELKVSQDTMHGANAEQYVQDIHHNYFHTIHEVTHEGWQFVKDEYSMILTHKVVKTHGYYSGIVSKVEEQVKKHPKLFAKFDKSNFTWYDVQDNAPK